MNERDIPILTRGNDFYLRINVFCIDPEEGRRPFHLDACEKWGVAVYGGITHTRHDLPFGLDDGGSILLDCAGLRSGTYEVEVTAEKDGRQLRCAERCAFRLTEYNENASVTFEPYDAESGQDLDMTFEVVSSAMVKGKNAYELAVENGYEGTLDDFINGYKRRIEQFAEALQGKQDTLTFDMKPEHHSSNPVTSGGLYAYIWDMVRNKQDVTGWKIVDVQELADATLEYPDYNTVTVFTDGSKDDGRVDRLAIKVGMTNRNVYLWTFIIPFGDNPDFTLDLADVYKEAGETIYYPEDFEVKANAMMEVSVMCVDFKFFVRAVDYPITPHDVGEYRVIHEVTLAEDTTVMEFDMGDCKEMMMEYEGTSDTNRLNMFLVNDGVRSIGFYHYNFFKGVETEKVWIGKQECGYRKITSYPTGTPYVQLSASTLKAVVIPHAHEYLGTFLMATNGNGSQTFYMQAGSTIRIWGR